MMPRSDRFFHAL